MNRLKLPLAVIACLVATTGVAQASTSPTVATGAVTSIGQTTATLTGSVDPNGAPTTYAFQYGPTAALGSQAPSLSAGSGTKAIAAKTGIAGLTPGTTYYYRLTALNSDGSTGGAVRTFKSAGNPPPGATTGAPEAVTKFSATLTGVVYPQGGATEYYFNYGLDTNYGLQTRPVVVPAGIAPVSVAVEIQGLAPGTTFHYQLVAEHGATAIGSGADASFETFPSPVPKPRVTVSVTPRHSKHRPYVFMVSGRIINRSPTPPTLACGGTVTIGFHLGRARVARVTAPIEPNCTYASAVTFRRLPGHVPAGTLVSLTVNAGYSGDDYLAKAKARQATVTLG